MASALAWASASAWARMDAALAANEALTLAPSAPARDTVAASSTQLGHTERLAEASERSPRGGTGKAGLVEGPAQPGERPPVSNARCFAERTLDPGPTSQGDDHQVQERAEGVTEVGSSCGRFAMETEVGSEEASGGEDDRRPQRQRPAEVRATEQENPGEGRDNEEPDRVRA